MFASAVLVCSFAKFGDIGNSVVLAIALKNEYIILFTPSDFAGVAFFLGATFFSLTGSAAGAFVTTGASTTGAIYSVTAGTG